MNINLNQLTIDHAADFNRWIADKEAIQYSLSAFLPDRDYKWSRLYLSQICEEQTSWNQAILCDDKSVGYCGLTNISKTNCNAEYFILIGDREFWNKGIGTLAGHAAVDYGLIQLGLHRIWLTVSELNYGAIRSYEKIGFVEEGRMRDACYRNGRFHDKVVMSILEHEWPNKAISADAKKRRG